MALKTVDLTQQPHRAIFTGCSEEEVNYAKTFWQSLQLLPPMESRLVSSDIKQRLRKAPPSRSMSESGSESHDSALPAQSLSVNFSVSSEQTWDDFQKMFGRLNRTFRSGSLVTQTSKIANFGETSVGVNGEVTESSDLFRRERSVEELTCEKQSHRKISVSAAGKSADRNQMAGNKVYVLGAGGREFWSHMPADMDDDMQNEQTRAIEPFSGEDLCRRKGFINWTQQKFMWNQTGKSTSALEYGSEELRGKPIEKPYPVSSQCTDNSQCSETAKPSAMTPAENKQTHHKKRHRVVGEQLLVGTLEVLSLFQNGNIQPDSAPPASWPCTAPEPVMQPDMTVQPDTFRKHMTSSSSSGGKHIPTKADGLEQNSGMPVPPQTNATCPKLSEKGKEISNEVENTSSGSVDIGSDKNQSLTGKETGSKIREQTISTKKHSEKGKEIGDNIPQTFPDSIEKMSSRKQNRLGQMDGSKIPQQSSSRAEENTGRSAQLRNAAEGTDSQPVDTTGSLPIAEKPAAATRPSTNIFYWAT